MIDTTELGQPGSLAPGPVIDKVRRARWRQVAAGLMVLLAAGLAIAAVLLYGSIGAAGGCGGG